MAFNVSSLPDYVQQERLPLIARAVLGARTIDFLNIQTDIKTRAMLNLLDTDPVFQAQSCGFNAQGSVDLTQRELVTGLIGIYMDFCEKDLLAKWTQYQVRVSSVNEGDRISFEEYITSDIIAKINARVDKAIWQGDTTSADTTLNKFDGFLKILNAEANTVKVPVAAGTSAYDAIIAAYMAIPAPVLEQTGVRIFVGSDIFRAFVQDLVTKNYYHYNPGDEKLMEFALPGTGVTVTSIGGLIGTNTIVAGSRDRMVYGTDLVNDKETFDLWYSKDFGVHRLKVEFNAGVQVAYPDEVVVATIASAAETNNTTAAKAAKTVKAEVE